MNAAQVHLIINHWPLVLLAIGSLILMYGELKLETGYKKLGLTLLIAAALATLISQFSGFGAMEQLSEMDNVEQTRMDKHAGMAFFTSVLCYLLGILSLVSIIMIHNTHMIFSRLRKLILVLAATGLVMMAITAHLGGEIRHPEIRLSQVSQ